MGKSREWKYVASLATALLLACAAAAQTNIAPEGQGYYWYGMKTSTATTNQTATTIINDGNLANTLNCDATGETSTNRYEGAGVIFPSAQSNITSVSFINGPSTAMAMETSRLTFRCKPTTALRGPRFRDGR